MLNKGKRQTVKATMPVLRIVKRLRLRNPFRLSVTSFGFFPLPLDVSDTGLVTVAVSRKSGIRYRDRLPLYAQCSNPPNLPLIKGGEGGLLFYFFCFLLFALCSVLYASSSEAKVRGLECDNCHTMHNSQNGLPMANDRGLYGTPPYGMLLRDTCVGCHMATNGDTWKDPYTGAPIVFNTSAPNYGASAGTGPKQGLAGGNFYWVADGGENNDAKGHNVWGISGQDTTLTNAPGRGAEGCGSNVCHQSLALNPATTDPVSGNIRRNGCEGCHVFAKHHKDDGGYRFLYHKWSPDDVSKAVRGQEDSEWERNPTSTTHNTYIGANNPSEGKDMLNSGGGNISSFCYGCHTTFHMPNSSGIGSSEPWLRHPSDVVLQVNTPSPTLGEYAAYTTYDPIAPVGRPEGNFPADPSQVRPGTDRVICVSCHRAHGSPYFKMMRWDYRGWPGNAQSSGCGICHSKKK